MFNVIIEMPILNLSLCVCCYERLCVCVHYPTKTLQQTSLTLYSFTILIALTLSYVHVLTSVNIKVIIRWKSSVLLTLQVPINVQEQQPEKCSRSFFKMFYTINL